MVELVAGREVAGRFRLVRELGRGGMGTVWLAHQKALDVPCAVKFIDPEKADAAELRARFEREARAAARINSPHVVQILDYGNCDGVAYIAMGLLEGEDLAARLARVGRLSPAATLAIVEQVARALGKAHALGIVHRDLKPDNIYLVADEDRDFVKILDFGIAKTTTPVGGDAHKTRTGDILGTPFYMSPEQVEGIRAVDHRSDLWSLAVIVYECLTGQMPFYSEALGDLFNRIMNKPLPVPSAVCEDLPAGFDAWWARAAARTVEERFQDVKDMVRALAAALALEAERPSEEPPIGLATTVSASTAPDLHASTKTAVTVTGGAEEPTSPPPMRRVPVVPLGAVAIALAGATAIWIANRPAPLEAPPAEPERGGEPAQASPSPPRALSDAPPASASSPAIARSAPPPAAASASTAPSASRPGAVPAKPRPAQPPPKKPYNPGI
jgi:serine/threonine-protein kinase